MRKIFSLLIVLFFAHLSKAQLIKDIGRTIKRDAGYRLEQKARQTVNNAIDSLDKKEKKKKAKENETENQIENNSQASKETVVSKETQQGSREEGEGFITLKLSTPVTTKGLPIIISGSSIKYGKWKDVKVLVKGPGNDEDNMVAPLNDSGSYRFVYDKLLEEGDYIITATSSDGKAEVSERLKVNDIYQPDDETKDLMDAVGKAFERLKDRASRLKGIISNKDDATLQQKISGVKEKLDALHTVMIDLKNTKKEMAELEKAGKRPSQNIRRNLAVLNQMIVSKAEEVKKIKAISEHEPYDNSICEYIAMLNEACAAFSTVTAFWAKSAGEVIRNIIIDKVVPYATEKALPDDVTKNKFAGEEATWGAKEAAKIFALAKYDMEGLTGKLGKTELGADLIQFATDVLMKVHCEVFKGTVDHYFQLNCTDASGESWWKYSVTSEAVLTLRSPKSSGGIIKMKGTIEGNGKYFHFMADPERNPEYVEGTGGKVKTMILKDITPMSLFFASSKYDEMGFGMAARAAVTPAYFLIPVDAEYNTETNKIKIFINEAIVDYSPMVFNKQIFIQMGASLISGLKVMEYPISKARLTIRAALKEDNEFDVKKDAKGNFFFSDKKERTIRSAAGDMEHELSVTIYAKKE